MNSYFKFSIGLFIGLLTFVSHRAFALTEVVIEIREHLFYPQTVVIPAGKKVRLTFINFDDSPEEIDSFSLNREKVIFAKSKGSIYIGPLSAGEYHFFGEFHPNSAVGKVVVNDQEEKVDAH
ncbi:cupredoxin domain-containing protein [Alteromonas stellipolaris]|uniref:cupredoxin domain-containing protein n=1 Tax=Alteromonas stellipolaris TaxID=233316 RepID=UPI0021196242|nr:cupredoxin domain-containing protein [Alteromonas stellipolaris]MCQ8846992.1 cupredoxin domain-containing protein [Alteromonas stellipolaris]